MRQVSASIVVWAASCAVSSAKTDSESFASTERDDSNTGGSCRWSPTKMKRRPLRIAISASGTVISARLVEDDAVELAVPRAGDVQVANGDVRADDVAVGRSRVPVVQAAMRFDRVGEALALGVAADLDHQDALLPDPVQRVVDGHVRVRGDQHALPALDHQPYRQREDARLAGARRPLDAGDLVGAEREADRLRLRRVEACEAGWRCSPSTTSRSSKVMASAPHSSGSTSSRPIGELPISSSERS